LIHIVDLDGSVAGRPRNADIILNIVENINVPVQIGGGIRDMETIRFYLDQGVSSVILGTTALKNQQIVREACTVFPGRIILGIDALNGKVAVRGWTENTEKNAVDLARQYEPYGVKAIVYTDIERDGMGTGINMKATRELADSVSIPVIASEAWHRLPMWTT
jgi:phosphoribosylformimino-5-aminoimidazole carboxamide ribotide isomerase